MKAILIAPGQNDAYCGLDDSMPVALMPLADRPFIQHVIEYLARQGVQRFEFVLNHLPEKIEACLGDGSRWGCSFEYHLAASSEDAFRVVRTLAARAGEEVLLGSGECLPGFSLSSINPDTVLCRDGAWTGWGVFASQTQVLYNTEWTKDIDLLPAAVRQQSVDNYLSATTPVELLRSEREALDGSFAGLMITGRQGQPGIRISRNVTLHPSVILSAPVYIGENSRIGRGARLGPSTVIGANCIVELQSSVKNSLVAPGTYVGEELELDSVIVNGNRLLNVPLGTSFTSSDHFLLGSLTVRSGRTLQAFRDRVIALSFLLIFWPLLAITWIAYSITRRGSLMQRPVISIPAPDDPSQWRTRGLLCFGTQKGSGRAGEFFRQFLPGLVSVLTGNLFLVGVRPRSRDEVEALETDRRSLYLNTKAGLITEASVVFGPGASEDEIYTAEAYYSATESTRRDARLAGLWLRRLMVEFFTCMFRSGGRSSESVTLPVSIDQRVRFSPRNGFDIQDPDGASLLQRSQQ